MKPPSRLRSAPARYRLGSAPRVWSDREKRRLLQALRAQAQAPGSLRPELLKKYLPSKEEGEIMEFVDLLKERVAREAVKDQYRYRQSKQKDAPIPAPIEVWTELAEKLTGCLEDAVTAAFSQALTIASAEPICFLHSVPPKPVEAKNTRCSSPTLHNKNKSNEETQETAMSSNLGEPAPVENGGFQVDFEKIYKYLSVISRGSKAPELTPGESAVLLDLLLSLQEELGCLDFKKLENHMYKCYLELNGHYTEKSRTQAEASPSVNNGKDSCDELFHMHPETSCLQEQEGTNSLASSKGDETPSSVINWKTLGICPLNSFMFPLDLLAQKGETAETVPPCSLCTGTKL
ncbi:snRNA-activating protein complex subunit 2 [Sceloporus undulatus]|uniref:snRNA-activating protein complex subunit 2 n=1 Tax=Sceloporus undulatus TaxID=8520 RepID=UPI001C4B9889|nr:snRNA-activating protein complex subunit 2 [Sceloporus undulatus]